VPSDAESVIAQLCSLFARQADELIDLHDHALKRVRPGLCVQCYFRLQSAADPRSKGALVPLRSWLESNIEVVAKGSQDQVLETLPLRLEAPDLEGYCRELMADFREDRAYRLPQVTLEFQYKAAA
jgi:hypothetical protein